MAARRCAITAVDAALPRPDVCIASRRHPRVQGELTSTQFLASPHVRPLGTGRPTTAVVLDKALARTHGKIERLLLVQNFLMIPSMVARTDMLATLPMMLAATFATSHALQILELPTRVPRIRYAAYWHERSHNDEGHQWLRKLVKDAVSALGRSRRNLDDGVRREITNSGLNDFAGEAVGCCLQ